MLSICSNQINSSLRIAFANTTNTKVQPNGIEAPLPQSLGRKTIQGQLAFKNFSIRKITSEVAWTTTANVNFFQVLTAWIPCRRNICPEIFFWYYVHDFSKMFSTENVRPRIPQNLFYKSNQPSQTDTSKKLPSSCTLKAMLTFIKPEIKSNSEYVLRFRKPINPFYLTH